MSPYEIGVMLHYYVAPIDHPDCSKRPPVWQKTLDKFVAIGMLKCNVDSKRDSCYCITEKGTAYVQYLMKVELPICKWIVPHNEDN